MEGSDDVGMLYFSLDGMVDGYCASDVELSGPSNIVN
jgi:hypothetical protein